MNAAVDKLWRVFECVEDERLEPRRWTKLKLSEDQLWSCCLVWGWGGGATSVWGDKCNTGAGFGNED